MGYRLHYAQHYEPKWEGGYFNWKSEEFAQLVYTEFEASFWLNEDNSGCELERADIEKYIEKLLKDPNSVNPYFDSVSIEDCYTNKEVAEAFTEILKSDDNTIHMEWF